MAEGQLKGSAPGKARECSGRMGAGQKRHKKGCPGNREMQVLPESSRVAAWFKMGFWWVGIPHYLKAATLRGVLEFFP